TDIYPLSLHDALPISCPPWGLITTVETLILPAMNESTSAGGGGDGSPSLMMIMCFIAASLACNPFNPSCMMLEKLGMSIGSHWRSEDHTSEVQSRRDL